MRTIIAPIVAGAVLLSSLPLQAYAAQDSQATSEAQIQQLLRQIQESKQQNQTQAQELRSLMESLNRLEKRRRVQAGAARPAQPPTPAQQGASTTSSAPPQEQGSLGKKPPARRSTQAVYQEQNALFTRRLTIEPGFRYSYYDRSQPVLNGLLALGTIFLGSVSLEKVKSNILEFDLTGRYGVTNRLQATLTLPFLYRRSEFVSGGVGFVPTTLSSSTVTASPGLGDVYGGIYYKLFRETVNRPDVIWNLRVKAPTGSNPYGIKLVQPDPNNTNLLVPTSLPTGDGLWAVSTGFSFLKTSDPAILFTSVNYMHYFARHFGDISNTAGTVQPGKVQLGDIFQYGLGLAFALNDRMSISFSYAQAFAQKARQKADGQNWSSIVGSDANAATFNVGLTYGLSEHTTMVTNLGIGLTRDAPNVVLSMKFPYSF